MEDARATSRWYLLVAMGRKAGHLALGIGKAAGATLTLIPEEFAGEKLRLARLADVIEGSIIKRRASGDENGTVVLAEGIAELLDPADLEGIEDAERDDHGHVRLSELPLGDLLKRELKSRFSRRGITVKLVAKDIGYELRCAHPIPFDEEYTRDLGYGAARAILEGGSNCMITRQNNAIVAMPFRSSWIEDGPDARAPGRRDLEVVRGGAQMHDPTRAGGRRGSAVAADTRRSGQHHRRGPARESSGR